MIEQEDYKSRAVTLRRSARAQVLELRRARIAQRRAVTGKTATIAQSPVGVPEVEQVEPAESELLEPASSEPRVEPAFEDAPQEAQAEEILGQDDLVDELDDAVVKQAAMDELSDEFDAPDVLPDDIPEPSDAPSEPEEDADITDTSEPQAEVGLEAEPVEESAEKPMQPEPPADVAPESSLTDDTCAENGSVPSDLERLPGAGPGLIWMLNQCGVFSLADLAEQDSATLSSKLGVVGQILDVERWIAFAADASEVDAEIT